MYGKYITKNGTKLEAYLWEDFLSGDTVRTTVNLRVYKEEKIYKHIIPLYKDDNGLYFKWDKEVFYLNDFIADTYEGLLMRLDKGEDVSEDEMIATFLKHSDEVRVMVNLPTFEFAIPSIGLGITGDRTLEVLCVLTENRYKKSQWAYKLEITPMNEDYKRVVPARNYYSCDFVRAVKDGRIKLTMDSAYAEYLEKYNAEQEEKYSGFGGFLRKMKRFKRFHKGERLGV